MADKILTDFLPYTVSQRSASLVLTESDADTKKAITAFKKAGFKELIDISMLAKQGKYFVTANDFAPNVLNDMLVQYGSGQITLHNKETGLPSWINPTYAGSSLVLVATKEAIQKIEAEGIMLLNAVGPTLQI